MIGKNSIESYKSPKLKRTFEGRPAYLINHAQLQIYVENGFTVPQIATMLSVSKSTIRRRLCRFGISVNQSYSNLTDDELDLKIKDLISKFPNCGYRRMNGFLLAASIRIQEKWIQQSMRRVDPNGVLLRSLQISFQRLYFSFFDNLGILPHYLLPITPLIRAVRNLLCFKMALLFGWKNKKNWNQKKSKQTLTWVVDIQIHHSVHPPPPALSAGARLNLLPNFQKGTGLAGP